MKLRGSTLAIVLGLTPSLWAAQATLNPLKGSTYLQHAGKTVWEEVHALVTVDEGDHIRTSNDSQAFLILPDDHRVAVGAGSELVLSRLESGETKIYIKAGIIRNKVRPLGLGQYYKVQSPTAVVAVRGTDFAVSLADQHNTQVRVYEGFVDVGSLKRELAGEQTRLVAGQMTSVDAQGTTAPPKPMPNGPTSNEPDHKSKGPPPPPGGPPGATPDNPGMGHPGKSDWYNHPDQADPGIFDEQGDKNKPTSGNSGFHPGGPFANNPGMNGGKGPDTGTGGDGFGNIPGPGGSNFGPPPGNTSNPPPTGSFGDPIQALKDEIQRQNLASQLQGILVGGLFQDGAVKIGPDGQLHQYADAVIQNGSDGIKFVNATMINGIPNSLNYQVASIKFNQPLPSDYTMATRTAFRGDPGGVSQPYYATDIANYRSNTVDYIDTRAGGGLSVLDTTINRYVTKFTQESATVNGVELYNCTSGSCSYYGGAHPSITFVGSGSGLADGEIRNNYASTGPQGPVFIARHTTFANDQGVKAAMSAAGTDPGGYLAGMNTQDYLYSNLFTHGPILTFGSARSRLFGGIDSILSPQDAFNILNGNVPVGMPDGLLRS